MANSQYDSNREGMIMYRELAWNQSDQDNHDAAIQYLAIAKTFEDQAGLPDSDHEVEKLNHLRKIVKNLTEMDFTLTANGKVESNKRDRTQPLVETHLHYKDAAKSLILSNKSSLPLKNNYYL